MNSVISCIFGEFLDSSPERISDTGSTGYPPCRNGPSESFVPRYMKCFKFTFEDSVSRQSVSHVGFFVASDNFQLGVWKTSLSTQCNGVLRVCRSSCKIQTQFSDRVALIESKFTVDICEMVIVIP